MPFDADLPPTQAQRWIGTHKVQLRTAAAIWMVVSWAGIIWSVGESGWGPAAFGAMALVLVGFPVFWKHPAELERFVRRYDQSHPRGQRLQD